MMDVELTNKNFLVYAMKAYNNPNCMDLDEFQEDLKRFQYLKRLFKRYEEDNDLRIRLILNHIIILYNCFGPAATNMLFMKLSEYHKYLKTFMIFLSYMPEEVIYEEAIIKNVDVAIDENIALELRKL